MPVASVAMSFTRSCLKMIHSSLSFLSLLNRTDLRKISKPVSLELREVTIATSLVCCSVANYLVFSEEL